MLRNAWCDELMCPESNRFHWHVSWVAFAWQTPSSAARSISVSVEFPLAAPLVTSSLTSKTSQSRAQLELWPWAKLFCAISVALGWLFQFVEEEMPPVLYRLAGLLAQDEEYVSKTLNLAPPMTLPLTRLVSIRKNVRHRVPLQGSCDSTGARPTFCAPSWPGSESLAPFQYVWPGKHASTLVQSCWTPVTATYGSIDTGKVVEELVSIAWSGSRSSSPGLTRTPTGARLAPDASHMLAAGAPNTSWSTPSTAVSPPAAVARSDTPVVASA